MKDCLIIMVNDAVVRAIIFNPATVDLEALIDVYVEEQCKIQRDEFRRYHGREPDQNTDYLSLGHVHFHLLELFRDPSIAN